ncbi:hypothetical protein H8L32_15130 [Undibacterium sp. CY18W]|uniref:Uncharacterized protein n=1 Tax=Undibacterium hunanense TaxID=2762292 RepID=A0ABR6ZTG2_9BURK|nr:hypothetical protein [Undibacterium hunanense]MBC3918825.1 hypothetical protein [Undibacterium hunanense]
MLIDVIKNSLRNIFRVRNQRAVTPAGPKPAFGSTIVLKRLKMQLIVPIDYEQWDWLTEKGWRTLDMRQNRRRYFRVQRKAVTRLLHASQDDREALHQQIVEYRYDKKRLH